MTRIAITYSPEDMEAMEKERNRELDKRDHEINELKRELYELKREIGELKYENAEFQKCLEDLFLHLYEDTISVQLRPTFILLSKKRRVHQPAELRRILLQERGFE